MAKMKTNKAIYLLIAVVAIFCIIIAALFYQQMLMLLNFFQRTTTTTPTPENKYIATLPMKFTITDMWKGGVTSGATVTLYKYSTKEEFDRPTESGSTGVYTTTKAVTTNERYWVKVVSADGNAKYFYDVTVPYATSTGQEYHYYSLDFYTCGTYAISLQMPNGTSLSRDGKYNITQAGNVTYPTFTVMIRNNYTGGDSGLRDYFDPIKLGGIQRETVFVFKISGNQYEQLRVQNFQIIYQTSSARYYGFKLDPMKLVLDKKPDGTYNTYQGEDLDGIYTFNIQFDCSALTAYATGPTINFYLYTQDNLSNFQNYGTHLSDAILLDSFGWEIDA